MKIKNHNLAFGKVIRKLRLSKNLTQEDLAFDADLDRTYISLLELGQRSPTLDTQILLSHALDVQLSVILHEMETLLQIKQ